MVHDSDTDLMAVARSGRHFFLRQEAAQLLLLREERARERLPADLKPDPGSR